VNRIYKVQKALLGLIDEYDGKTDVRDKSLDWERIHMASCAKVGLILARRRGIDGELAAIACAVHDIGRIVTGRHKDHAEAGFEPVQVFLKSLGFMTDEEIAQIAPAVRNHSKKGEIGTPLEELVKDADLIDFRQYGFDFEREDQRLRFERIGGEI